MLMWDKYENRYRTVIDVEDIKELLTKYQNESFIAKVEIEQLLKDIEE